MLVECSNHAAASTTRLSVPYLLCKKFSLEACDACASLKDIDSRIHDVQESLRKLLDARQQIVIEANRCHDPMSTVPVEVISQIFLYSTEGQYSEGFRLPATRLAAVSRRWRYITLSLQQLWTSIRLSETTLTGGAEVLGKWLGRSGQLPLRISITCRPRSKFPIPDSWVQTLDILSTSFTRWDRLYLDIPPAVMSHIKGKPSAHSILTQLEVISDYNENPVLNLFHTASPTYLTIKFIRFKALKIGWGSLVHLDVQNMRLCDCVEMFRHCINLEECDITGYNHGNEEIPPLGSPHVLPSLRRLHIAHNMERVLFRYLTLPSLEDFHASGYGDTESLISMFARSMPPLRTMELNLVDSGEPLIRLLRLAPSIQSLTIETRYSMSNHFFDLLSSTALLPNNLSSNNQFLPRLHTLYLSTDDDVFTWTNVARIFPVISEPAQLTGFHLRPLSKLEIKVYDTRRHHFIDEASLDRFEELRKEGIDIWIFDDTFWEPHDLLDWSRRFLIDGETYTLSESSCASE